MAPKTRAKTITVQIVPQINSEFRNFIIFNLFRSTLTGHTAVTLARHQRIQFR